MTDINSSETYYIVSVTNANTLELNDVNSIAYKSYISGGILSYKEPQNLSGVTARMQIREKLTDTAVIDELTTENGMIVINNTNKTITIQISATKTAAYSFTSAVYSLELVDALGVVTSFVYGNVSLVPEVTR